MAPIANNRRDETGGRDPKRLVGVVMMAVCFVIFAGAVVAGVIFPNVTSTAITIFAIIGMVVLGLIAVIASSDPDHVKARQSDRTLRLASNTVEFMRQGLNASSAQAVCELLLPEVSAISVAITDHEKILGFAGIDKDNHRQNSPIQTQVTHETLEDGQTRVIDTAQAIGFKHDTGKLKAAIIVPLTVRDQIIGTLKFYYSHSGRIDENQLAMAEGFAQLFSTQLSLAVLDQQTELATRMELKALQAQINPHFLFNTINTIASYTRTDPDKARIMLREFAVYYRRLLENSDDLIEISSEVEQTERYLMFQRARFGEESIFIETSIEPGLEHLRVPAFIIQPLVENSVGHGRREAAPLHLMVKVYHASESVIIEVKDDGLGIPSDRMNEIVDGTSQSSGMGIALGNVDARLKGFFGSFSGLHIESEFGVGTTVYLSLYDALENLSDDEDDD